MAIARASSTFQCVKGEDYQITWTIQTSDTNTTAVDITGWTFALKVKERAVDADPSLITPTITIVTPLSGLVKAVFAAVDTLTLNGDYEYSFWRTNSGSVSCLSAGIFSVIDTTQN